MTGRSTPETTEDDQAEEGVRSLIVNTGRILRWTPQEPSAFLPRLFRTESKEEPQLVVEEINDDLLISDLSDHEASEGEADDYAFTVENIIISEKEDDLKYPALAALNEQRDPFQLNTEAELSTKWGGFRSKGAKSKDGLKDIGDSPVEIDVSREKANPKRIKDSSAAVEEKTKGPKSDLQKDKTAESRTTVAKSESKPRPRAKPKRRRRRRSKSGILIYGIEDEARSLKSTID